MSRGARHVPEYTNLMDSRPAPFALCHADTGQDRHGIMSLDVLLRNHVLKIRLQQFPSCDMFIRLSTLCPQGYDAGNYFDQKTLQQPWIYYHDGPPFLFPLIGPVYKRQKEGHLAGYLSIFMSRALFLQNLGLKNFPGRLQEVTVIYCGQWTGYLTAILPTTSHLFTHQSTSARQISDHLPQSG